MALCVRGGGGALGFLGTADGCLLREVNERGISQGYNRDDVTKMRLGLNDTGNITAGVNSPGPPGPYVTTSLHPERDVFTFGRLILQVYLKIEYL